MSLREALAKLPEKQQHFIITKLAENIVANYHKSKQATKAEAERKAKAEAEAEATSHLRSEIESLY